MKVEVGQIYAHEHLSESYVMVVTKIIQVGHNSGDVHLWIPERSSYLYVNCAMFNVDIVNGYYVLIDESTDFSSFDPGVTIDT